MILTIFHSSEASYLDKLTLKRRGVHKKLDTRRHGSLRVLLEVYILHRPFYIPSYIP